MTPDLVIITDKHHLRIETRDAGVRFLAMRHDEAGLEAEEMFADVTMAKAHVAQTYGVADWAEVGFKAWSLVRISDDEPEPGLRGRTGHVVGLSTPDSVAVMVDGLERVWCIDPVHLIETGGMLADSERPDPSLRIRVSTTGEVLG